MPELQLYNISSAAIEMRRNDEWMMKWCDEDGGKNKKILIKILQFVVQLRKRFSTENLINIYFHSFPSFLNWYCAHL